MIAAELRGGSKPSLNEALGWIGSRVDDIYGAAVGRLEDVWIDPGTGVPRWLLVQKGGIGGRSTLIPFEDANAGAGHVWIPYERDVVADAPEVDPAAPLTQQAEAGLRRHYVMYATRGSVPARPAPVPEGHEYRSQEPAAPGAGAAAPAAGPHRPGPEAPQPQPARGFEDEPPPLQPPPAPSRPPAPEPASHPGYTAVPPASASYGNWPPEPERPPPPAPDPFPAAGWPPQTPSSPAAVPPQATPPPDVTVGNGGHAPPAPAEQAGHEQRQGRPPAAEPPPAPPVVPGIDGLDRPYRVEIQLRGEVQISGELSGLRITPIEDDQAS